MHVGAVLLRTSFIISGIGDGAGLVLGDMGSIGSGGRGAIGVGHLVGPGFGAAVGVVGWGVMVSSTINFNLPRDSSGVFLTLDLFERNRSACAAVP